MIGFTILTKTLFFCSFLLSIFLFFWFFIFSFWDSASGCGNLKCSVLQLFLRMNAVALHSCVPCSISSLIVRVEARQELLVMIHLLTIFPNICSKESYDWSLFARAHTHTHCTAFIINSDMFVK